VKLDSLRASPAAPDSIAHLEEASPLPALLGGTALQIVQPLKVLARAARKEAFALRALQLPTLAQRATMALIQVSPPPLALVPVVPFQDTAVLQAPRPQQMQRCVRRDFTAQGVYRPHNYPV